MELLEIQDNKVVLKHMKTIAKNKWKRKKCLSQYLMKKINLMELSHFKLNFKQRICAS